MNTKYYSITPDELIFLLGLLEIEPRPETVLIDWLAAVNIELLAEQATPEPAKSLLDKGWIWYDKPNWHLEETLAQALEGIAGSTTKLTVHVQQNGSVADTHYAQYKDQFIRYFLDDMTFNLYPSQNVREIADTLLPEDLQPNGKLAFRQELDLASLFLLNEASWQTARAFLDEEEDLGFQADDLINGLEKSLVEPASRSWLGLELDLDLEKLPLHSTMQDLINRDLLETLPGGRLRLTLKSDPYNQIISDPDLFGLSCVFQNELAEEVELASWLFGSGEILQIEAVGNGEYQLNTLFSAQIISEWIQDVSKKFEGMEPPPAPELGLDSPRASRQISPKTGRAPSTRRPWLVRLLRGLAGTVFSVLVIGTLSSTIIGLIQGDLEVTEITGQLGAGIRDLAAEVNLPLGELWGNQSEPSTPLQDRDPVEEQKGSGAEESTSPGNEAEIQAALEQIEVVESRLILDGYRSRYALAVLQNGSDLALSRIEVEIVIKNSSGEELLREKTYTRAAVPPGEKTSLDRYIFGLPEGAENFSLEIIPISARVLAVDQFVDLELEAMQIFPSNYNEGYVTVLGEMINPTDQIVSVETGSFLRDGSGQLAATEESSAVQDLLLPGERVPFSLHYYPLEKIPNLSLEEHLTLIIRGQIAGESTREPNIRLSKEQTTYIDQRGLFHIVGQVLNEEESPRDIRLIGAVYDQNGLLVDACTDWLRPRGVPSGGVIPYDINCWVELQYLFEASPLRERAVTFEVMVERQAGLREAQRTAVPLAVSLQSIEVNSGYLEFSALLAEIPEDKEDLFVTLTLTEKATGRLIAVFSSWPDKGGPLIKGGGELPEGIPELTEEIEISAEAYAY